MLSLLLPAVAADTEPNDSFADAEAITPGTYTGTLTWGSPCDCEDFYSFTVAAGQTIYVNVTSGAESHVGLYDEAQDLVDYSSGKTNHAVTWTVGSARASQTFYAKVQRGLNDLTYELTLAPLVGQNDAGTGRDAGDGFDAAVPVSVGASYAGFVQDDLGADGADYYVLSVESAGDLTIDVWNDGDSGVGARFLAADRTPLTQILPAAHAKDTATFPVEGPTTVYIVVEGTGPYRFQTNLAREESGGGFLSIAVLGIPLWTIIVLLVVLFVVAAIVKWTRAPRKA